MTRRYWIGVVGEAAAISAALYGLVYVLPPALEALVGAR